ncbi:MAG: hypothetical protein HKN14_07530 [Marinicaulis sp.]|nr:hypothetical protein [Marinicaulis sp.]
MTTNVPITVTAIPGADPKIKADYLFEFSGPNNLVDIAGNITLDRIPRDDARITFRAALDQSAPQGSKIKFVSPAKSAISVGDTKCPKSFSNMCDSNGQNCQFEDPSLSNNKKRLTIKDLNTDSGEYLYALHFKVTFSDNTSITPTADPMIKNGGGNSGVPPKGFWESGEAIVCKTETGKKITIKIPIKITIE